MHLGYPEKGIETYCWIETSGCRVQYTVPGGKHTVENESDGWSYQHLEVDSWYTGKDNWIGTFQWEVLSEDGNVVADGHNEIDTRSGNVVGGTMTALSDLKTKSATSNGEQILISYGFYEAGDGLIGGLPKNHQFWVTVTPDCADWMGKLAPEGSLLAQKPLSTLVLPAPHDVGMNSMENAITLLKDESAINEVVKGFSDAGADVLRYLEEWGLKLSDRVPDIVSGLAITQKDTVDTLLHLGGRYFEFRPAYPSNLINPPPLPHELFFQHLLIPGMAYKSFLESILAFLAQHPLEIVVVHLREDGVHKSCTPPTQQEKDKLLEGVIQANGSKIIKGNLDDMLKLTIDGLRAQKKRLIVLDDANQYSSYSDTSSATLTPEPIIKAFEGMSAGGEKDKSFAIFQCQATATRLSLPTAVAIFHPSTTASILLCTKAKCDQATLPWLRQHVPGNIDKTKPMVIMNDFFDGATAQVAVELSQKLLSS